MRGKIGRLLIALGILLSGTVIAPYAAFPSEKIEWQNFASAYIYEDVADLSVTKSGSSDTLGVGQPLTYTIVVTNAGPDKATGVTLIDTLPLDVSLDSDSITATQGDCDIVDPGIRCDLGDLEVDDNATVTFAVIPTIAGEITNTVRVFGNEVDPIIETNEAIAVTEVTAIADLTVTKSGSHDPVAAGSALTYTILVTNAGPSDATGVILTDTLIGVGDFGFVSSSQGECNGTTTPFICNLGDVTAGDNVTITFVFTPTMAGVVSNTVEVEGIEFDPDLSNNQDVVSTEVVVVEVIEQDIGGSIVYTDTHGLVTRIEIPGSAISETTTFTYTHVLSPIQPTDTLLFAGRAFNLVSSARLVAGQGVTMTLTYSDDDLGKADIEDPNLLRLRYWADDTWGDVAETCDPVSIYDIQPEAKTVTVRVCHFTSFGLFADISPKADLSVTKTSTVDSVKVGETLAYTITVVNNGPDTATNVVLTDTLQGAADLDTVSPSQVTCNGVTPVVCDLGTVANEDRIIIRMTVTPTAAGTLTNTVQVGSETTDPDLDNNEATVSTEVFVPTADLTVAKISSRDSVKVGEALAYTITVVNNGPDAATNVVLTDTLQGAADLDTVSPNQVTCSETTPIVCDLGTVVRGDRIIIGMTVTPTAAGTLTNTVQVGSETTDPNLANNEATVSTSVMSSHHQIYLPIVIRSQN